MEKQDSCSHLFQVFPRLTLTVPNPYSKKMESLVGKLSKEQQEAVKLLPFSVREDMGELDEQFFADPKWYATA